MSDENANDKTYRVEQADAGFDVIGATNRVLLHCRDRGSAEHYAALMNEAFRAGYHAGYRAGKQAARS